MSAPAVIDSCEFARAGQELSGTVAVASLKRLEDILYDSQGSIDYAIRGSQDARKRLQLRIVASGKLHLQCQRCLGRLDDELAVENTVLLLEPGRPHDPELDDPEGPDAIEASDELDVVMLIEDEVLLSLPISPRHDEGECVSRLGAGREKTGSTSAFAQLEALKGSGNRKQAEIKPKTKES